MALGAPAELLLMGFPTYGRTFRLSGAANGLGAPANGAADIGIYTGTAGFWAYYEVMHGGFYMLSQSPLSENNLASCCF